MNDDKKKADELAGDGSDTLFAEAKRLGLRPAQKPSDDVLLRLRPASRDDENDCDDDDEPERLVYPPELRLEMLEGLVERIINAGPVKAALDADEWFEVRVTCRQIVPDEELHHKDRDCDPTGSILYLRMAPDADTARERALDRFANEVAISRVDDYEVTAEAAESPWAADHDDECECDKCEGIEEGGE